MLTASVAFLVIMASSNLLTPATLLIGLAGMGLSNGTSSPSWWSTVANLVPADVVPVAMSLDSFQWNFGQVVGPILGGAVLHDAGTTVFYAMCGAAMVPLVVFLFFWRGRSDVRLVSGGPTAESFLGAISAGWRYFTNTPGLRAIAARTALYVTPAVALGTLLPLFSAHYLHATAFGYGLYLSCSGVGAMAAALLLPRLQGHLHLDAIVAAATVANALAVGVLVIWPTRWAAPFVLVVTGGAWVWATVGFIVAARQVTPSWVQTRTLSLFYVVMQGPFVIGGIGFGIVDTFLPLRTTLLVAAVAFIPGILVIPRFGLPVVEHSSLELVATATLSVGSRIHLDDGPVMILVEYRLAEEDVDDFLVAMAELRVVRRRLGGTRWGVFEDVSEYGRFLETFLVQSWGGYLLQREHYTLGDMEIEARASSFHRGPGEPVFTRLVHPETIEAARSRSAWRREMLKLITERT
jgi:predicted MFS family arabinose efflux permease